MLTLRLLRKYVRHVLFLSLSMCLILYFAFHALQGKRGLLNYFQTHTQLELAQDKLNRLIAEREELERRVSLLQEESLDLDLLDQQARELLHMTLPNETTIYIR